MVIVAVQHHFGLGIIDECRHMSTAKRLAIFLHDQSTVHTMTWIAKSNLRLKGMLLQHQVVRRANGIRAGDGA